MTAISCISLITPVGYTLTATCAALRAGIAAFEELNYRDCAGMPILGARIAEIPLTVYGQDRLNAIAQLVIEQIDVTSADELAWANIPLILCTRIGDIPGPSIRNILSGLTLPDGSSLSNRRILHVAIGQPSAFVAMNHARDILRRDGEHSCLILAVDSLIDSRTLAWLDAHMRLRTTGTTDGLIPGEAGCLAMVSLGTVTRSHVTIRGLGFGTETATAINDIPLRAAGLTAALREALREASIEMHEVAFRISDVAGESYAFEELVLAQIRAMRKTREEQPVWHAADCIGDTGATAGLIQLAWVEQALTKGYAPGEFAALHGSSPGFCHRAAAIVSA